MSFDQENRKLAEESASLDDYYRKISEYPLLTVDEEVFLATRWLEQGDEAAFSRMVLSNLRLVIHMARRYRGMGMSFEDLVCEGNMGLVRALRTYDPSQGRIVVYAALWIRQNILRALTASRLIRYPVGFYRRLRTIERHVWEFKALHGREPEDAELAKLTGLTLVSVRRVRRDANHIVSLDLPVGEDGSTSLEELIEDSEAVSPREQFENDSTYALLRQEVTRLPSREAKVLTWRYGLDGRPVETLDEVGKRLGITRERVRQLQVKALRKIRSRVTSFGIYST